jgi:hypothetical protein
LSPSSRIDLDAWAKLKPAWRDTSPVESRRRTQPSASL